MLASRPSSEIIDSLGSNLHSHMFGIQSCCLGGMFRCLPRPVGYLYSNPVCKSLLEVERECTLPLDRMLMHISNRHRRSLLLLPRFARQALLLLVP